MEMTESIGTFTDLRRALKLAYYIEFDNWIRNDDRIYQFQSGRVSRIEVKFRDYNKNPIVLDDYRYGFEYEGRFLLSEGFTGFKLIESILQAKIKLKGSGCDDEMISQIIDPIIDNLCEYQVTISIGGSYESLKL